MVKKKYNVIIVGSGFSGIAASDILSNRGLNILMIDEYSSSGGQLLRKISNELGINTKYRPDYIKKAGNKFLENLKKSKIDLMQNSTVLGVYGGNEILVEDQDKKVVGFNYDHIIFATGARERFLPFKGWTLPGVISTGMAQVLMKSYGVLPAKEIYVAGTGLFLFSVTYELLKNGARVYSIFEMNGVKDKIKLLPSLIHTPSKAVEGIRYMGKILFSGVPFKNKRRIIEARGNGSLEEIVLAKTDRQGSIKTGSEKILKTGSLAIGYGFAPNIELPLLAGCRAKFIREYGGWVVDVDSEMETTVDNVFTAGETTGIGGALKSINEGKIAANSILRRSELIDEPTFKKNSGKLLKKRKHHLEFARLFNSLYSFGKTDLDMITDDTIICRCEDVRMGDIRKTINDGFATPGALKLSVRAGMGNCQGRTCGPLIYDLLFFSTGCNVKEPFSARPPVKPVKIENFSK